MDLEVPRLGPAKISSPLQWSTVIGDRVCNFVPDDDRILFDISLSNCLNCAGKPDGPLPLSMEHAGPRERPWTIRSLDHCRRSR